jgi:hypothetical protein
LKNEKIRIEEEDEDEHKDEDDIIAGCVLPASYRRGKRWISLLVN